MFTGETATVTVPLALFAGLISIVTPCVLALIPAYLTYLSGVSIAAQGTNTPQVRLKVMLNAGMFVVGFTLLFVAFGLSAAAVGQVLLQNQTFLRRLSGIVVIVFGLHTAGVFQIPFLLREARVHVPSRGGSPGKSLLIGMAFAAGWTPCVGPILGSILLLASHSGTVSAGFGLLLAYSFGMALPFLAMALYLTRLDGVLRWLKRNGIWVSRVAGVLLIAIGVMLYTNTFVRLAAYFNYWELLP